MAFQLQKAVPESLSGLAGAYEVSLGHALLCSHHRDANHAMSFLCWASPSLAGSPTHLAESRSLEFRANVWLRPFTVSLAVAAVIAYWG